MEDIQAKLEALAASSMKLGEAIYKSEQAEAGEGDAADGDAPMGGEGDAANDETIVDATSKKSMTTMSPRDSRPAS
jgi:molecular chaperone DnaK